MKVNEATKGISLKNEAWITVDKNRYYQGEPIIAVLRTGDRFVEPQIKAMLTDSEGNTGMIVPVKSGRQSFCLPVEAKKDGTYTLLCIIEDSCAAPRRLSAAHAERRSMEKDIWRLHIASATFFVGDCEAAIPKVPDARLLFVPEIWEEPDFYKLISVYLKRDGKPVSFVPVTLLCRNRSGRFEKALTADASGNVFFVPYLAGVYCLASKVTFEDDDYGGTVEVTTTFSFTLSERGNRRRNFSKTSKMYPLTGVVEESVKLYN